MRAILIALSILSACSHGAVQTLTYEPATVNLIGTLDLQTFPGPPNYESVREGDAAERHFFLKLDAPVDVVPQGEHPTVDNPEEARNVRVIQLVIGDESIRARFGKGGIGARVRVTGTLFQRFTGHHHSRVLLNVGRMELAGD